MLNCRPAGPDSLLAVLLPSSTLTSERARRVREELASRWQLLVLIYAAGVIPELHKSFELAAVFLRARQQTPPALRVFRVPTGPNAAETEEDFQHLLARQGGRGRFGYVIRDAVPSGEGLAFERHDPDVLARRADLSGFGTPVRLGEVFELPPPAVHLIRDRDAMSASKTNHGVRVLTGRDIRRDGTIAPADDQSAWAQIPPDLRLRAGDIVLREFLAPSDPGGLVAAEVTQDDLPAAASERVIVLRPAGQLGPPQRLLALLFLRSRLARTLAVSSGATSAHISRTSLLALPVPQPDAALGAALSDLAAAAERLNTWRADAEALLQSVFLDGTAAVARTRIVRSGRLLRLRAEAASLLDDFGYTVRTRFPHPVAYRWRWVEASISNGATTEAYEAVLDSFEILLCYAAQLGLVMCQHAAIGIGAAANLRAKLTSGRSGLGLGEWVAILEEIGGSKALRRLPESQPLGELRTLLADNDVDRARRRLSNRRNDQAHLRRVDAIDLPDALDESLADLTALVKQAEFLCDLPLIHVTTLQWDALQGHATVWYRELMGDHPVVPTRMMQHPRNDLEQGSLYVVDSEGGLHLLRPFLIGRVCPTCRNWSTFHVDRATKDGTPIVKSLEHGHTSPDISLAAPLRQVGLL